MQNSVPSPPNSTAATRTITVENQQEHADSYIVGLLSLSTQASQNRPRVQWSEDVIDNEHMNKKKSKSNSLF